MHFAFSLRSTSNSGDPWKSARNARQRLIPPKIIIGDGTLSKAEEERMMVLLICDHGERQYAEGKYVPAAVVMKRVWLA